MIYSSSKAMFRMQYLNSRWWKKAIVDLCEGNEIERWWARRGVCVEREGKRRRKKKERTNRVKENRKRKKRFFSFFNFYFYLYFFLFFFYECQATSLFTTSMSHTRNEYPGTWNVFPFKNIARTLNISWLIIFLSTRKRINTMPVPFRSATFPLIQNRI